jgi:hypothetical protein
MGLNLRFKTIGRTAIPHCLVNIRFWHKADIPTMLIHVRFWGVKRRSVGLVAMSANDPIADTRGPGLLLRKMSTGPSINS